jgi:hypothetical protein
MSEPTPHSDPATEPVVTERVATERETTEPPETAPQVVYVPQQPSRLNKAAAWVGIAAGSVFIVAVIFGAGVFVGKNIDGGGQRHHHGGGPEMVLRPGPPFPPGPAGGYERGPGFPGSVRPGGPMIDAPRPPTPPGAPATSAPPRP